MAKTKFTKIAYDISEMKPGCVIIQAAMGCDPDVSHEFHTDHWLVSPSTGMKVYPLESQEQLDKLVEMTNRKHSRR